MVSAVVTRVVTSVIIALCVVIVAIAAVVSTILCTACNQYRHRIGYMHFISHSLTLLLCVFDECLCDCTQFASGG